MRLQLRDPATASRRRRSLAQRRAERELLFWTLQRLLLLVFLTAMTVYAIAMMLTGRVTISVPLLLQHLG